MTSFADPGLSIESGQLSAAPASSPLAQLAADFRRQVKKLVLDVPGRDGYTVEFDPVVPYELYQAWQLASAEATGVNGLEFAVRALASQCRGVSKDDEPLAVDGRPVTFDHPALQQLLGAVDTTDTVRRFYGSDGVVLKASGLLMREAGYGVGDASDPTKR